MLTYEALRQDENIRMYITRADESLIAQGFTEHSFAHVTRVAEKAGEILTLLGYDAHTVEMARIAGYLHDIGNLINRCDHSQSGALMAFRRLEERGMSAADISLVAAAIGNHDDGTGVPVNPVAAALILADKTDVRRSRVRNAELSTFDIHDRVNYSVVRSSLQVNEVRSVMTLYLDIDSSISPVMDYFEIFLGRMVMCRKAAESLGCTFRLIINDQQLF